LDQLQFLLTLRNNSWPCAVPTQTLKVGNSYHQVPLATQADWPCYIPGITDLDQRILLVNDKGVSLKPRYVWGRRNNELTLEETLVVMFDLRKDGVHLFDGSENIYLVLTGFENEIRLKFPLSTFKNSSKQTAVN
jgi:hypothetical protein